MNPPQCASAPVFLVYDGDCPFCSAAAQMVRIRQAVGDLQIINARDHADSDVMRAIKEQELDLNEGIVVSFEDRLYHGPDAMYLLAMIGSEHGWMNRLNIILFRNPATVRFAYPIMKSVRNTALWLLGRKPI